MKLTELCFRPLFPSFCAFTFPDDNAPSPPPKQPNKVYIGNLSDKTTEADLQEHFGSLGHVISIELKCVYCPSHDTVAAMLTFETNYQGWLWLCGV